MKFALVAVFIFIIGRAGLTDEAREFTYYLYDMFPLKPAQRSPTAMVIPWHRKWSGTSLCVKGIRYCGYIIRET